MQLNRIFVSIAFASAAALPRPQDNEYQNAEIGKFLDGVSTRARN